MCGHRYVTEYCPFIFMTDLKAANPIWIYSRNYPFYITGSFVISIMLHSGNVFTLMSYLLHFYK